MFSVTLPAREIEHDGARLSLPCTVLAVEAPAGETVRERVILRHPEPARLSAQYATGVELSRDTGGALAAADYEINENCGHIRAAAGLDGVTVEAQYTAHPHRYDLVGFDLRRAILVRLAGTARIVDPEEYRPKAPRDVVPVHGLYVWKDGVEVIDLSGWNGFARRGEEGQFQSQRQAFQAALAPALETARRRKTIRIAGYGDSITTMGQRVAGMHAFPNGPVRDKTSYFSRYPKDTVARLPRAKSDDGVRHTRIGWCWSLVRAFEQNGIAAEYRNWGIPGTAADAGSKLDDNKVESHGGGHPARLEPLLADNCDIVVLAFGTNEIGETGTEERIQGIVERIHGSGARCIVLGAPPLNPYTAVRSYDAWRETNAAIARAAEATGAAYLPLENLFALGNEGAVGLSRRSYAAGSLINHPGISELQAIGGFLAAMTL
ncbi:MAG: SGNH/GDSL hydrolase family protein [Alphaproteobacteria bacterium]|nr:SGNH/GDSL hydrolase family protein [Alphaproteobacteria bacterium]